MSKDSNHDLDLLTATPALPQAQAAGSALRRRLGELLVEAGFLSPRDLDAAIASQALSGGLSPGGRPKLGQILLEAGMISDAQLTQTLGQQLSVPFVSLKHVDFSAALLAKVPAELAQAHTMLPVFLRSTKIPGTKKLLDTLYVAMEDPTNQEALLEVSMRAGLPVKPMIASPADLHRAIRAFYFGETGDSGEAAAGPDSLASADRSPEAVSRRQAAQTLTGTRAVNPPPKPPPPKIVGSLAGPAHPGQAPPPPPARDLASQPQVQSHTPSHSQPQPPPAPPSPPRPALSTIDDEAPEIEVSEIEIPLRSSERAATGKGGNITLLDGTSVAIPRRARSSEKPPAPAPSEAAQAHATTRELLMRLRVEGDDSGKVVAVLVHLLVSHGVISEVELHAELKKLL